MRLRQTHLVFPFLIALLGFIPATHGAPPDSATGPLRCAFIDIDQSPLAGLVEAELLTRPGTEWLERTEIQKLLAEKELQSLLAASAGDDRTALGQVLKADVLVILKTTMVKNQSFGDLVVAETRNGLRLVSQRLPLGQDLQEIATLAAELVDTGISKARSGVKHVFAVPPFLSNDLTYEFDYLRSTYAKLLEQSLLDSEDVVVVELEEARAVANELRLTSADGSVKRQLPIYLMGEYRSETEGDEQTVQLSLRVQQGNTELDSQQVKLRADAVPEFLRENGRKIAKSLGIETLTSNPAAEAHQLNERARQFIKLANWQEALGLIEASLLLLPDQPQTLSEAIQVAGHLARSYDDRKLDELEKAKELNRRSLAHLRTLAANHPVEVCRPHFDLLRLSHRNYLRSYDAGSALSDRLARLEETYVQEGRQLALSFAHRVAEMHDWRLSAFLHNLFVDSMTPQRRYDRITTMILRYQNDPNPDQMVRSFAHGGYSVDKLRSLEGRRFLERLRENPEANDHVKRTVESLLTAIGTLPQALEIATTGDPHNKSRLTFKPLILTYRDQLNRDVRLKEMDGCLPLDEGMDVFYGRAGVFVLTQQKEVRQMTGPLSHLSIKSFTYDGRYLWMAASRSREAPEIWVLDPVSGKSEQLTAQDGLPLLSPKEIPGTISGVSTVSLGVVAPGRAIVAGYIGRTWLADVRFDPQGQHKFKVFHEAKEVLPRGTKEVDWRNKNLAFQPIATRVLSSLSESGELKKVVMVCRDSSLYAATEHALLVDPEDLSVRVAEEPWVNRGSATDPSNIFDGSYYYAGMYPPAFDSIGLIRVGMPVFKPEVVISGIREGHVLFNRNQERVNVVGMDWQRGRLGDEELESFGPVPWIYRNQWLASERSSFLRYEPEAVQLKVLADSNHFGSLLSCAEIQGGQGIVQVLFDGSGVSLKEALKEINSDINNQVPPRAVTRPQTALATNLWQDSVRCSELAYSPDGSLIVTTSQRAGESVRVWNSSSGQLISDLLDDPAGMATVAFSHDGKLFATGGTRGRVILWDTKKLAPIGELKGRTKFISNLAFSWKSDKLGATCQGQTTAVWNVQDGNLLYELDLRNVGSDWLRFNANDSLLLTSSHSRTKVWNATDGTLVGDVESLSNIAGLLSDRSLIASSKDAHNTLIKWDSVEASSEELWPRMVGIPVAISPDGKLLAIYVREKFIENERTEILRIEVWNLPNKKKLASLDRVFGKVYHFTPTQDALLIVMQNGAITRLELEPGEGKTDMIGDPMRP